MNVATVRVIRRPNSRNELTRRWNSWTKLGVCRPTTEEDDQSHRHWKEDWAIRKTIHRIRSNSRSILNAVFAAAVVDGDDDGAVVVAAATECQRRSAVAAGVRKDDNNEQMKQNGQDW